MKIYIKSLIKLSLFLSLTTKAQDTISVQQPERIFGVQQLLPYRFQANSPSGPISMHDILIGAEAKTNNPNPTASESLRMSRSRPLIITSYAEAIKDFWSLFLTRAQELNVSPGDPNAYDWQGMNMFGPRQSNPVRDFLIDRMGLSFSESYNLYMELQKSFSSGGLDQARISFHDFFQNQWESSLHLIFDFETLARIKQIQAELSFGNIENLETGSNLQKTAERIAAVFFNPSSNSNDLNTLSEKLIAEWVYQNKDKFDITNRVALTAVILEKLKKLMAQSDSMQSILQSDRINEGIKYENERNQRHAYGPKSKLANINNSVFLVLRAQLYLGIPFEQARGFINHLLKNRDVYIKMYQSNRPSDSDAIRARQLNIFNQVKSDFAKANATNINSCISFLR